MQHVTLLFWQLNQVSANSSYLSLTWRHSLQLVLMPRSPRDTTTCFREPIRWGSSFDLNKWQRRGARGTVISTADIIIDQWCERVVEVGRCGWRMGGVQGKWACFVVSLGRFSSETGSSLCLRSQLVPMKTILVLSQDGGLRSASFRFNLEQGAGLKLHHSWSGGFSPLKLFFAESSFAENHRGTFSCFLSRLLVVF